MRILHRISRDPVAMAEVLGDAIAHHQRDPALLGLAIMAHRASCWLPQPDKDLCGRVAFHALPNKAERQRMLTIAENFLAKETY